ncbi:MAG: SLBB domain-containing protein, partial [Terriglobales bacterium]
AGVYQVLPGESLRNVIARAGGLTPQAYLFGSEFTRESVREMQQKRFDEFVDRLERDVERTASTRSQNVTSVEEAAGLKDKVDSQRRLVEKLRTTKAPGRLVLGLRTDQTGAESIPDISLENGDRFVIPYRPATINVIGAVNNENSFLHQPGRSPAYYLRKAGGGTRLGDTGHTFIVRADGSIVGRSGARGWFGEGFDGIQLMPGDTIVVPERLNQTSILKGLRDWSQVFYQMALGVAAIRTFSRP